MGMSGEDFGSTLRRSSNFRNCLSRWFLEGTLSKHNLAAHHQAIGIDTWKAELISVDDDLLGTPFIENATEGYRIWLPS
jgi:hypothetical protein